MGQLHINVKTALMERNRKEKNGKGMKVNIYLCGSELFTQWICPTCDIAMSTHDMLLHQFGKMLLCEDTLISYQLLLYIAQ